MDYSKHVATTPQSKAMLGREKEQVENNAGGMVFGVDPWKQLDRFLILGTEGGSYYVKEREMTVDNAQVILNLIKSHGEKVVDRVFEISTGKLAPKQDPAIFVLALACVHGNAATKKLAYGNINYICRTGTHLFNFLQMHKNLNGKWSRGLRNGVADYYEKRSLDLFTLHLIKYRQRNGWTHKDAIRLSHPKLKNEKGQLVKLLLGKEYDRLQIPLAWMAFEEVQAMKPGIKGSAEKIAHLLEKFRLPWEAMPTEFHDDPKVWISLLGNLRGEGLMRNLSRLAKLEITKPMTPNEAFVADKIKHTMKDVHPIKILNGMLAYKKGVSERGHGSWTPSQKIIDSLMDAFYDSFAKVKPTGKRYLMALDVSGSMDMSHIAGTALTAREASVAMAMQLVRTEPNCHTMAFSNGFVPLNIGKHTSLDQAVRMVSEMPFDSTDCSLPMIYATKYKIPVDCFVVFTDNETWAGHMHPTEALRQYRNVMGIDAKLVVCAATPTSFTIADPKDPRQLDVVGFSLDTPETISAFVNL